MLLAKATISSFVGAEFQFSAAYTLAREIANESGRVEQENRAAANPPVLHFKNLHAVDLSTNRTRLGCWIEDVLIEFTEESRRGNLFANPRRRFPA